MKKLSFFIFIITCINGLAQITFQKSYGGVEVETLDCSYKSFGTINSTIDSGHVICYSTNSYGHAMTMGVYLFKINKYGDTLFTKTYYRSDQPCFGRNICQTRDSGYIIGVGLNTSGAGLIKTNCKGDIIWSKNIGSQMGYYGLNLSDNTFLCTGGEFNIATMSKLDCNGNLIFGKRYKTASYNELYFYSSYECSNKDILSTGVHNDIVHGPQLLLVRTDSLGNVKFAKAYNLDVYAESGYRVKELSNKDLIVLGSREITPNFDILLMKTDLNGNPIFCNMIGDSITSQWANSIATDSENNLYLAGSTNISLNGNSKSLIIKTNSLGNILWSKVYNNGAYNNGIVLTNDAGIITAGANSGTWGAGMDDVYVCKTDSNGDAGCDIINYFLPNNDVQVSVTNLSLIEINDLVALNFPFVVNSGTQISTKCQNFTTSIDDLKSDSPFFLYPNPTNGVFTISGIEIDTNISIYNAIGELVKSIQSTDNNTTINLSDYSNGIYFIKMQNNNGEAIQKLIKQ